MLLDIWVVQHAFEIPRINLYNEIFHTNDVDAIGMEGAE
jgi:hypothetical protein